MLKTLFEANRSLLPTVSERELALYERHFALLVSWNERMNLVSRKSIDRAFGAHYADSLWIAEFAQTAAPNGPVFDVGTGAGFPGVLFAIRYPDQEVTLFEKSLKKQTFLAATIAQLDLSNVSLAGAAPEERRAGLYLARAVFPGEQLFEFMRPRMAKGSTLIRNLGGNSPDQPIPGDFRRVGERRYTLPQEAGDRRVEALSFVPRETKGVPAQRFSGEIS